MSNEVIKLSKISKKFVGLNKNITVLKNVNFKINPGELHAIISASSKVFENN